VNWAILRGERRTGNTMMFLAAGADTGDIIDQRVVAIGPDDTCATVYAAVAQAGATMLREHLPALLAGTAPRRPQDHGEADLLPKRTPEMGITDWQRPARQVHDWIRALTHPYPGAFARLKGRKVYLWGSRLPAPAPAAPPAGKSAVVAPAPGALLGLAGEDLRVQTGAGTILITRVQQEHEAEESGAAWYTRRGLRQGVVLDAEDPALLRWARGEGPRP
jgi:methionyl-tRNA formyltransferase